ncbi:hypothetical protein V7094_27705 [Priestia megaterium]|uniref:hypothetical protein n=1 Tax=Priestia megaterium TaxID=1404 RepID=UPI00300071C5
MTNLHLNGQSDVELLVELDDAIEEAKLELQRVMSLLDLGVGIDEAFSDTLKHTTRVVELVSAIKDKDASMIAMEKLLFYSEHFDKVVKQTIQIIKPSEVTQ